MLKFNKLFATSCIIILPSLLFSANKIYLEKTDNHIINTSSINSAIIDTKQFNNALGFSPQITLHERKSYLMKNGITKRYTQKYKGIPILGEEVIIHENTILSSQKVFGTALYDIGNDINDITPKITKKEALRKAKELFSIQLKKSGQTVHNNLYTQETSKLKIWQNNKGKAVLIYDIKFMYNDNNPTMPHYYIDAHSGLLLHVYDNLMHAQATGPGGNIRTGQYNYGTGGLSYLNVISNGITCTMDNINVLTMDLNHDTNTTLPENAFSFTCPENTYKTINGGYSPLNDAHFFGGVVFNMYNDWFNTAPLTFKLIMQVHYGTSYENAFWNGSRMTFGDGASTFYPLVDLNVVSHEVSHGFTQQNSNLIYSGKSGGLNESFSDMAGEAAEFYHKGNVDWLVGADIMKSGPGLRSISDPTSDGRSIDHQSNYTEGLDVHLSSGVYNKAFYLLSTTIGWDPKKSFEVYVKANQLYWTASTDWDSAARGVLTAASDLGYNLNDVCTSLNLVGVYPAVASCPQIPPAPPPTYTILDISNAWTVNSPDARHRTGNYAEYYTFTLTEITPITINLESSADTYMFLLDSYDNIVDQNDDGGVGLNSKIVKILNPGTYTIEATTYSNTTGTFTLKVLGEGINPKKTLTPIIMYLLN
jgi:vibriolysin